MEFREGDLVVVPGCGVGEIDAVESMEMDGIEIELYRIQLGEDMCRMWVPIHRVVAERIRPVMPQSKVEMTWKVIEDQEAPAKRANWNRRKRRYNKKLLSNEPRELAEVLGELAAVRANKPLSFYERRLYDKLRDMMIDEFTAAMGKARTVVEERMSATLTAA